MGGWIYIYLWNHVSSYPFMGHDTKLFDIVYVTCGRSVVFLGNLIFNKNAIIAILLSMGPGLNIRHLFSFCVVLLCVFTFLSSVLWDPLRFPYGIDVQLLFASSCLWEGSCIIYIVCIYVRWWCPTHVVLCFVCIRLVSSAP